MANPAVEKILTKIEQPDLINKLVESCSGSELNSLLLEVFNRKASEVLPNNLLKAYSENRFVQPSTVSQIDFLEAELLLLKQAAHHGFNTLELSPVGPLGSCSSVALVDQNKVMSALRGTEVLSDVTNALALEASQKRINSRFDDSVFNACTVHRVIRTQALPPVKGFTSHFKLFGAVSAGRDTGNLEFEKNSLRNHLLFYADYLVNQLKLSQVKIILKELDGNTDAAFVTGIFEHLQQHLHDVQLELVKVPRQEHQYYDRLRFSVDVIHNDQPMNLGDGGLVDWSQKANQQQKRTLMLISGLGLELVLKMK